jgi:hypothetical protein
MFMGFSLLALVAPVFSAGIAMDFFCLIAYNKGQVIGGDESWRIESMRRSI